MYDLIKLLNSYYTKTTYEYEDLNKLVQDAISHQVYPYLYPVLKNKELKKYTINSIQTYSNNQKLKELILNTFNSNDIDYIFLKGTYLSTLYEEPYLRTMGDIDVLVKEDDYLKSIKLFKQLGAIASSDACEHHTSFEYNNLEFELHLSLFDLNDKRYNFFKDVFNHKDNHYLELEYEIVYELCHMEKHIYHGGAGLRHLIDFDYLLKKNINYDKLNKYLEELDLKEFFINIKQLSLFIFDFNTPLSDIQKELLTFLYKSGCHGNTKDAYLYAYATSNKQSKFKYLWSKAFPSFKQMKALYPILNKHPILLPIYRIKKLFHVLKKHKTAKKVMTSDKQEINEVSSFLKGIGLNK